jgi:GntR family transcriptional regulator of arabinose operon
MTDIENSAPKYHVVEGYIKDLIDKGELLPGDQLPSENELVRQFNVSRHTVRQALGELGMKGWIYKEKGKGTFCAYRKSVQKNKSVMVLTTYISDYIFPFIIKGIEDVLSSQGYSLILANTDNDKEKEAHCMENFLSHDIAGMIIEPTASALGNPNIEYFKELERRNVKYIMINAVYDDLDPAYIIMDDELGGFRATNYLLQIGHRKIAGIFKSDDMQGIRRKQGFMRALAQFDITLPKGYIGSYNTMQMSSYPYQFTKNLLEREDRPTAIVCYNDQIAINILEAIREEGLKVPDDISVIGYDDSNLAVASEVKLTTIKHPKKEMGTKSAQYLIDMIEGNVEKPRMIYQPELIVRSSCRGISRE